MKRDGLDLGESIRGIGLDISSGSERMNSNDDIERLMHRVEHDAIISLGALTIGPKQTIQ
jgi:hypothetical protein